MKKKIKEKKTAKEKGLFARLMDKLDKKMEEKTKNTPCCSNRDITAGGSCCS